MFRKWNKRFFHSFIVLIVIVRNPVMCCVLIWERVVSKILERIREEEILQINCRQLNFWDLCNKDIQLYRCVSITSILFLYVKSLTREGYVYNQWITTVAGGGKTYTMVGTPDSPGIMVRHGFPTDSSSFPQQTFLSLSLSMIFFFLSDISGKTKWNQLLQGS